MQVKAQDIVKDDVLVGTSDGPVAAPPRIDGGYVFIDVRDLSDGRAKIARSNRRWNAGIITVTRQVDELVEIERPA